MCNNEGIYSCNAIFVTKILCNRYSTINNFAKNNIFKKKFNDRFSNLIVIKCTKLYSNLFTVDIFIVRCLRGYFFRIFATSQLNSSAKHVTPHVLSGHV